MVFKLNGLVLFDIGRLFTLHCLKLRTGVNMTLNVSSFVLPVEEQVHEEVAERRRGLQRAGGGGRLPGLAVCCVRSSAASCDAGSLNRGSCSHKVAEIHV